MKRIVDFIVFSVIFLVITSARPKDAVAPESLIKPEEIKTDTIQLRINRALNELSKSEQEAELARLEIEKSLKEYAKWRLRK